MAESREHALSDVDIVVIGSAGLADLLPALRKVEKTLHREVNAITYTVEEWRTKVARGDHFVRATLKSPKVFLKGTTSELEELARSEARASS